MPAAPPPVSPPQPSEPWPELEQARRVTRRRILITFGTVFAGSVTCAGLVATPFLRQGPYGERPQGLKALRNLEYAVLRAAAAVVLGTETGLDDVLRRIDETIAAMDPPQRKGTLTHFTMLENAGFLLGGRLRPFTELTPDGQRRVLVQWSASRILVCRQTVRLIRELVVAHSVGAEAP